MIFLNSRILDLIVLFYKIKIHRISSVSVSFSYSFLMNIFHFFFIDVIFIFTEVSLVRIIFIIFQAKFHLSFGRISGVASDVHI